MKIERMEQVIQKLQSRIAKSRRDDKASVIVGYTAAYALYVHENMEIWPPGMRLAGKDRPGKRGQYWDPQGRAQPKFLEEPARRLAKEIGAIIKQAFIRGATMAQALLLGGLRIQRESQLLVPVDTGALKNSAFTRLE